MRWVVLHDGGGGVTQLSLEYFKKHAHRLGRIFEINLNQDALFSMEIQGSEGVMLLSGCNCGYGGEGPHGTMQILDLLGLNHPDWSRKVFSKRHVKLDLRRHYVSHEKGSVSR